MMWRSPALSSLASRLTRGGIARAESLNHRYSSMAPSHIPTRSTAKAAPTVELFPRRVSVVAYSSQLDEDFHVFVNYHGEDVQGNFLSHLLEAFHKANIDYIIDENLLRGVEILPALRKAIEESPIAVIIFSKNYAFSPRCLDELIQIINCNQQMNHPVIPIFYDVSPSVVLRQSGIYADAFAKHERDPVNARNVPKWRDAMAKAAGLAGIDAQNIRFDARLVGEIIKCVKGVLNAISIHRPPASWGRVQQTSYSGRSAIIATPPALSSGQLHPNRLESAHVSKSSSSRGNGNGHGSVYVSMSDSRRRNLNAYSGHLPASWGRARSEYSLGSLDSNGDGSAYVSMSDSRPESLNDAHVSKSSSSRGNGNGHGSVYVSMSDSRRRNLNAYSGHPPASSGGARSEYSSGSLDSNGDGSAYVSMSDSRPESLNDYPACWPASWERVQPALDSSRKAKEARLARSSSGRNV